MSGPPDDPAELRQQLIREPQPLDDAPVGLTRYQAHRCAAIIDAFAAGHQGYQQAVRDVQDLLHALAAEAAGITPGPPAATPGSASTPGPGPGPARPARPPHGRTD